MPELKGGLVDARGRPIVRQALTEEVAVPTLAGVRSPLSGHAGDGLDPLRLASILREAEAGNPIRYLELAETIEERDLHLVGVLGTRRRSVSQLEITVEPGDDSAPAEEHATMLRNWLKRDELADELFDMLDAIHKGYSFTEIVWDTSSGQWLPDRLEYRDPRWFDFDRITLSQPQLIDEHGERRPLDGGKFIFAAMKAKSGLALRGGLARNTAWAWMFKAFSNRDWAIFTQTYGQPVRIGKYGAGASQKDKDALFRAIANVAGDMAAMIPDSMKIEFIESKSIGASSDLYERRIAFLDQQVSKAVLGQTATTDAIAGGHAVGQEHRLVQEDIERADAKQLSAVINRDLVRIWIDLEYGPQPVYPRLRIGRPEVKDIQKIAGVVRALNLPIKASEAYGLVGLSRPEADDEVIRPGRTQQAGAADAGEDKPPLPTKADPKGRESLNAEDPGEVEAAAAVVTTDTIATEAAEMAAAAEGVLLDILGGLVADPMVRDLEDLRSRLLVMAPTLSPKSVAAALRRAVVVAELTGRADLADG